MRLVVDTNIFVSAALKRVSWPGMVLRWLDTYGGLLKTDATEREVIEVLRRPRIAPKIAPGFREGNVGESVIKSELPGQGSPQFRSGDDWMQSLWRDEGVAATLHEADVVQNPAFTPQRVAQFGSDVLEYITESW